MITQTQKSESCSLCGKRANLTVLENVDFSSSQKINFSAFSAFKNPSFNLCLNCGKISSDIKNENTNLVFDATDPKIKELLEVFSQEYVVDFFVSEHTTNELLKIRSKAKLFDAEKFEFDKFLSKNYRKTDEETKQKIKNDLVILTSKASEICFLCENFLSTTNNNFVKCLFVEMLAFTKQTKKATFLLDTLCLDEHTREYLLDAIDLGGKK